MDYTKALFAFHVRQLAGQRVMTQMPKDLEDDEKEEYRTEHYEGAVESVLSEIDWTMRIIDKQGA